MDNPILDEMPEAYISQSEAQGDVLVEKLLGVNWNNIAFTLDKAHPKGLDALMALATALHENAALKVKLNNSADVSNSMQNNLHALLAAKDARIAELQNRLDSLPENEGWSKQ